MMAGPRDGQAAREKDVMDGERGMGGKEVRSGGEGINKKDIIMYGKR